MVKYRAFFSYARADEKVARWLHRQLDGFRTPTALIGTAGALGPVPEKLHPIFRDRTDLQAGGELGEVLRQALEDSDCLVVLCTPFSAKSQWVNREIEAFVTMGKANLIFPVVAGDLDGDDFESEYYPPALRGLGLLAADLREIRLGNGQIRGDGKDVGRLKLIAGLLGIDLDQLTKRERRRQRVLMLQLASASILFAGVAIAAAAFGLEAQSRAEAERKALAAQVQAQREAQASAELAKQQQAVAEENATLASENAHRANELLSSLTADMEKLFRSVEPVTSVFFAVGNPDAFPSEERYYLTDDRGEQHERMLPHYRPISSPVWERSTYHRYVNEFFESGQFARFCRGAYERKDAAQIEACGMVWFEFGCLSRLNAVDLKVWTLIQGWTKESGDYNDILESEEGNAGRDKPPIMTEIDAFGVSCHHYEVATYSIGKERFELIQSFNGSSEGTSGNYAPAILFETSNGKPQFVAASYADARVLFDVGRTGLVERILFAMGGRENRRTYVLERTGADSAFKEIFQFDVSTRHANIEYAPELKNLDLESSDGELQND